MRKCKYFGCRHPKTRQELKSNIDDYEFTRGKRRRLPDSWHDKFVHWTKSWKDLRKDKHTNCNYIVVGFTGECTSHRFSYLIHQNVYDYETSVFRHGYMAKTEYLNSFYSNRRKKTKFVFSIDGKKFPDIIAVVSFRGKPPRLPKNAVIIYDGPKVVEIKQV